MDDFSSYASIISALLGFLSGCVVTISVQKIFFDNSRNTVDQSGSNVRGDQAGRDIRK